MTSYSLNLPNELKQKAENLASQQGIPLEAFILDAIAEKVNSLKGQRNDPTFAHVTYRNSASGQLIPILHGTNLRVQTIVIAAKQWGLSSNQIATEYDLNEEQIDEALVFYHAHREEIDHAIAALSLVSSQPELTMNLLPFFESFYLRYGEDKRAIAS